MTRSAPQIDEFRGLLGRLGDRPMTPLETRRLNELLTADVRAQQMFVDYAILDACLEMVWTSDEGWLREMSEVAEPEPAAGALPVILEGVSDLHAPLSAHYLGGGFLFSYAAAVLIVGLGLLIGWAYQVSIPRSDRAENVRNGPPSPAPLHPATEMVVVGRISDMVECRWADPKTGPIDYVHVALGQKYALASGLMEITYSSGAKVILQGPCVYEVESRAGGYLSLGCLTARVGERGESREQSVAANQQSTINNRQSPSLLSPLSSPLSPLPSPLFTVRTPTAKITDLGTEFAVAVDRSGGSVARVYKGKVEVVTVDTAQPERAKVVRLERGESARVVVGKDKVAKLVRGTGQPSDFVRQMPRRVRITMFNTGVNLKDGQRDPHWQLVARSDDSTFKPRAAVVTGCSDIRRVTNQADRSQWISGLGGNGLMPDGVTYTFRTTFDLKGMRPSTAVLHGRFVADNHVRGIRLNGHPLAVPAHGHREFGFFHPFSSNRGFVEGINVLEIDVENGDPQDNAAASMMGLLAELDGSVVAGWPDPPANVLHAKQENSKN